MAETYAQQLDRVQATIAKIEQTGQAYQQGNDGSSRQMTRADLETLYERERYLRGMAKREARGRRGIGVVRGVPR